MTPPRFSLVAPPMFVGGSRRTMQDEIDDLKRARALRVVLILALIAWGIVSTVKLINARHELRAIRLDCGLPAASWEKF